MKYRTLGRTALDVGIIGLGTEYLINRPRKTVLNVIHAALARGINYFDLFFAQAEFRNNMGAAFKGYREKAVLAAHLGAADIDGQYERIRASEQCEQFFLDFLTGLQTGYADILFLHNSDSRQDYETLMKPGGLLDMATRFQREGKTRFIGFSGHNTETSRLAVETGAIDVLMFPLNLSSHAMPGRQELIETCVRHQVGLVAMKPYAGGNLLRKGKRFEVADNQMGRTRMAGAPMKFTKSLKITPVQCLAYVLDQTGVSTTVPGCASIKQLDAALAYPDATEMEKNYMALLPDFETYKSAECVHCNHCLPCPSRIDIGQTLRLLQSARQKQTPETEAAYQALSANASDCIRCGECVERCPFDIDVIAQMETAEGMFG
jgi:uncharacterized protein